MINDVMVEFKEVSELDIPLTVYYISTRTELPHIRLWLTKEMSLSRMKKSRVFVRDINKAFWLVEKILSGDIREGISLNEFEKAKEYRT